MAKFDFFAEKININNANLVFEEKFLNLKYGNLNKKSEILNKFKGWLKNNGYVYKSFISNSSKDDFKAIKQISGIYENPAELQEYIKKLPKYSFAIWFEFELKMPYFSKDDDEFYIIQNPVLKEKNFKVPMIRGSSWKGALAHAFRELFMDNLNNNRKKIESFLRIFGAGSENIKVIESYIFDKSKKLEDAKEKLLNFMLFELGLKINRDDIKYINSIQTKEELIDILKKKLSKKIESLTSLPPEFQTHKGRAIFYPTYFDSLSLEIINPHDRRKRAGKRPIHYEVVPKETKGKFQLIYIPFDGILKNDEDLKKEAEEDLKNLVEALENLKDKGIGAKTKLGWGTFKIEDKKVYTNSVLEIPEGWKDESNRNS